MFQVFAEQFHVQVAVLVDPLLVDLHGQGADQPQAALFVGEDAHEQGAAYDLLVEPLEHVGRLEVFVVLAGQPVKGEGLVDVRLDPGAELGVAASGRDHPGLPRRSAGRRASAAPLLIQDPGDEIWLRNLKVRLLPSGGR